MLRVTHKERFARYRDDNVISKCLKYSHWTLPMLMVDFSHGLRIPASIERDYQEVGAMLVNNLAPKLCGMLFPSGRAFFNVDVNDTLIEAASKRGKNKVEVQAMFSRMEKEASGKVFTGTSYSQLIQAMRHVIVAGNTLLYRNSETAAFVSYGVQSYSVRRDGQGNVLDIVLREYTDIESLDQTIQTALRMRNRTRYSNPDQCPQVELYTRIHRKRGSSGKVYMEVTQEADDIPVGSVGLYPEKLCPWQAVTWNLVVGEHYGRGLVEDMAGGFAKLSDASHAAALYGIEMMKVLNLVAPGLGADIDDLANAESGEYVQGATGSVTAYENGDANKLAVLRAEIQETVANLSRAFMYKGQTRNAERVTAFELQQDAREYDTVLGGAYSNLAAGIQVPFSHVLLTEVNTGMLEGIVTGVVELEVVTGIPALGRSTDVANLVQAANDAVALVPNLVQTDRRISGEKVLDMIMAGYGVDTSLIFKSDDEMRADAAAAEQQRVGQQQMMNAASAADATETLQSIQQGV